MIFRVVVVFRGALPVKGTGKHNATVLYACGDPNAVTALSEGQIGTHDEVIELTPPDVSPGAAPVWMVVQQEPVTGGVMVVEDNPINLSFYTDTLSELGLKVHAVSTAEQAVSVARAHNLDLIIVDVRLPDANGFELCRTLGAEAVIDHCPMILMSADPDLADNTKVKAVGASDFIINPIGPAELSTRVLSMLDQSIVQGLTVDAGPQARSNRPRLRFFGRPAVEVNGVWQTLPPGRATDLLATMAAACPAAVTSEQMARFAWPSAPDVSASAVYTAVSRLRSFLSEVGLPDLVQSDRHGYFLEIESDQIDLIEFEDQARNALSANSPDAEVIRGILDLWLGSPFPSSKNDLLRRWTNRLVETRSRLIEALAVALVAKGETSEAASVCRDLLVDEPWRESMWALLITALYRSGRTNDALQVFSDARQRLRDELGLDPGPTLADLEMMVLTHDPVLMSDSWLDSTVARVPIPNS